MSMSEVISMVVKTQLTPPLVVNQDVLTVWPQLRDSEMREGLVIVVILLRPSNHARSG